jgi:hypothetical protein
VNATVTTHPAHPLAALDQATRNVNLGPDERAYYGGFILGWAAAMTRDGINAAADMVTEAKAHHYAATYTYPDAAARWQLLGSNTARINHHDYLRACGLLAGWKAGTADRPDADECTLDGARVLSSEEGVRCEHGYFCSDECRRAVCENRCDLPDFDEDAYYENKYGTGA